MNLVDSPRDLDFAERLLEHLESIEPTPFTTEWPEAVVSCLGIGRDHTINVICSPDDLAALRQRIDAANEMRQRLTEKVAEL